MRLTKIFWRVALLWLALAAVFGPRFAGLRAQTTAHGVTLTWTAPAVTAANGPAASYNILRGTSSGTETQLATVQAPTTTYLDATGVQGQKYFYEVTATNAAGTSPPSSEVAATFLVTGAPGAPGSPAASAN